MVPERWFMKQLVLIFLLVSLRLPRVLLQIASESSRISFSFFQREATRWLTGDGCGISTGHYWSQRIWCWKGSSFGCSWSSRRTDTPFLSPGFLWTISECFRYQGLFGDAYTFCFVYCWSSLRGESFLSGIFLLLHFTYISEGGCYLLSNFIQKSP